MLGEKDKRGESSSGGLSGGKAKDGGKDDQRGQLIKETRNPEPWWKQRGSGEQRESIKRSSEKPLRLIALTPQPQSREIPFHHPYIQKGNETTINPHHQRGKKPSHHPPSISATIRQWFIRNSHINQPLHHHQTQPIKAQPIQHSRTPITKCFSHHQTQPRTAPTAQGMF